MSIVNNVAIMSEETIRARHNRIIRQRHERLAAMEEDFKAKGYPLEVLRRRPEDESETAEVRIDMTNLARLGIGDDESAVAAVAKLAVLAPHILYNRACEEISLDTYHPGDLVVADVFGCTGPNCVEWYAVHGTETSEWRERLIENLGDTTFGVHNELAHHGSAQMEALGQYGVVYERVEQ